uniref:PapAB n=1 Tax=Bacillus pumilus TaxID=1408 RepID=A0A385EKB0_BACPU|nr:PapAB [Bacillus pumilus]
MNMTFKKIMAAVLILAVTVAPVYGLATQDNGVSVASRNAT